MAIIHLTYAWRFYFFDDPLNERSYVFYWWFQYVAMILPTCGNDPILATVCNIRYILQLGWIKSPTGI